MSTWFRDYIYIPLGGNRCSAIKHCRNLLATFILSGLWHGAGLHYVVWGLLHGMFQCVEKFILPKKKNLSKPVCVISTLFVFVLCSFAWIFFRTEKISDALWLIAHMFDGISDPINYLRTGYRLSTISSKIDLYGIALPVIILIIFDYISLKQDCIQLLREKNLVLRWSVYIIMTALWSFVLISSFATESTSSFIYFQF